MEVTNAPKMTVVDPMALNIQLPEQPTQQVAETQQAQAPPIAPTPPAAPSASSASSAPSAQAPEPPQPEDPLESVINKNLFGQTQETQWDENSLKLFKEFFPDAENPKALKERLLQRDSEFELTRRRAEENEIASRVLGNTSPALKRMLQLEQEGKAQEAIQFIRNLPDHVIQNREAKELSDRQLIDTYEAGKISPTEWEAREKNTYDELGIDKGTLDYKIQSLRQMAEFQHETNRANLIQETQRAEQTQLQQREAFQKAIAANIAQARQDPFTSPFLDQETVEKFTRGELEAGWLTESDGIMPSPNRLTTILKAKLFDDAVRRAGKVGYDRGKQDGLQEATQQMPGQLRPTRQTNNQDPLTKDAASSYLDQIEKRLAS